MLQIRWHGHSCWEITNNKTLVTDPHDGKSIGIPAPTVTGDIILVSHDHYDHNSVKTVEKDGSKVVFDGRKRTIDDVEIKGIDSFHDEAGGAKRGNNIMYKFTMGGIAFCHLGDLGHDLDEESVEKIGEVDIHYKIGGLSLPIAGLDPFLEQSKHKVIHVGNEIDIEKEDLPDETEVWTFTL